MQAKTKQLIFIGLGGFCVIMITDYAIESIAGLAGHETIAKIIVNGLVMGAMAWMANRLFPANQPAIAKPADEKPGSDPSR